MKHFLLVLTALSLLASPLAHARKPKKKKDLSSSRQEQDVAIHVPQSELDVGSRIAQGPPEKPTLMELGFSTWTPSSFTRPSYSSSATSFHSASLPFLSLNRLSPLAEFPGNGAAFYWVVGLSYGQVERTGTITALALNFPASETLSLVSLRAGLEYQGPKFLARTVQPFLAVSALPTYALATQTSLEERVSTVGLPFEAGAGLYVHPPFLRKFWSLTDGTIGIGAHYLFGSIDGSRMNGLGWQGTFSVTL